MYDLSAAASGSDLINRNTKDWLCLFGWHPVKTIQNSQFYGQSGPAPRPAPTNLQSEGGIQRCLKGVYVLGGVLRGAPEAKPLLAVVVIPLRGSKQAVAPPPRPPRAPKKRF